MSDHSTEEAALLRQNKRSARNPLFRQFHPIGASPPFFSPFLISLYFFIF